MQVTPEDQQSVVWGLLPASTQVTVNDSSTPQARAFGWSKTAPGLEDMTVTQILQRFVLATYYYMVAVPSQYDDAYDTAGFLVDSIHECRWKSALASPNATDTNGLISYGTSVLCRGNSGEESIGPGTVEGVVWNFGKAMDPDTNPDAPESLWREFVLPPELALLPSLEMIVLEGAGLVNTSLADFVPATALEALVNFTALQLPHNNLMGSLPEIMEEDSLWAQLTILNLEGNELGGSIPPSIGWMTDLTSLSLGGNTMTGALPSELGLLEKLTSLRIADNNFMGTLPAELDNLKQLRTLEVDGNSFTGDIPPSMCRLVLSETLDPNASGMDISRDPLLPLFFNESCVFPSAANGTVNETAIYGDGNAYSKLVATGSSLDWDFGAQFVPDLTAFGL